MVKYYSLMSVYPPFSMFKSDEFYLNDYIISIALFFFIFIITALVIVIALKTKFSYLLNKANRSDKPELDVTSKSISTNTKIHIVSYQSHSFLLVESSNRIAISATPIKHTHEKELDSEMDSAKALQIRNDIA